MLGAEMRIPTVAGARLGETGNAGMTIPERGTAVAILLVTGIGIGTARALERGTEAATVLERGIEAAMLSVTEILVVDPLVIGTITRAMIRETGSGTAGGKRGIGRGAGIVRLLTILETGPTQRQAQGDPVHQV